MSSAPRPSTVKGPLRALVTAAAVLALLAPTVPAIVGPAPALAETNATLADLERREAALTRGERETIQRTLAALGFYAGPIDADFGPGTRAAIRDFQTALGAPETGWLTADQIYALLDGTAETLIAGPTTDAGDTLAAADDLGALGPGIEVADRVDLNDREDFFRFHLDRPGAVAVTLTLTAGDADLALLDDAGGLIAVSNRTGTAAESLQPELAAGGYAVQVSYFAETAPYRLSVRPADPDTAAEPELIDWEAGWSPQDRHRVERAFALVGYLSTGIDGYFGARTRDAIRSFQIVAGETATGYLTRAQRVRLAVEAAEAAAELGRETAAAAAARAAAARSLADRAPPSGYEGYRGEIRNGRRDGLGVFSWSDGARYEGEFIDDRRHGLGVHHETDGDRYEGAFVDENRRGFGIFVKPDGRVWQGEFADGPFEGFGLFTNADGYRVAGEWQRTDDGGWSFTGYGEQGAANEPPRRGLWEASELVEPL